MAVLIPHFDLPFRYVNGVPAVVEQDTIEDISNCVEAILRTRPGQRIETPTFGITDPAFKLQPLELQPMINSILRFEPRAVVLMEQAPDKFDALIAEIAALVSSSQESVA